MEKSFALIKDGKVFNTIVATQETIDQIGLEKLKADHAVDLTGTQFGIGCLYENGTFTRPPPAEPLPKAPSLEERLTALEAEVQLVKEATK